MFLYVETSLDARSQQANIQLLRAVNGSFVNTGFEGQKVVFRIQGFPVFIEWEKNGKRKKKFVDRPDGTSLNRIE